MTRWARVAGGRCEEDGAMRRFVSRGYRLLVGLSLSGASGEDERAAIGRRLRGVERRPGAMRAPVGRSGGVGLGLVFGRVAGSR